MARALDAMPCPLCYHREGYPCRSLVERPSTRSPLPCPYGAGRMSVIVLEKRVIVGSNPTG
jgi:hypothetical protein